MVKTIDERPSLNLWRTAVALSLLQLALHVVAALGARDPRTILPHAVAYLHDLALLIAIAWIFAIAMRVSIRPLRGIFGVGGRCALIAMGMLLAVYPQMLQTFLAAPANFLEADAATMSVFLRDYAGFRVLWPAVVGLAVGAVAPRAKFLRRPKRRALIGVPLVVLALLTLLTLGHNSPNPIIFGLQDSLRQLFVPRMVPRIAVTAAKTNLPIEPPPIDWATVATDARYDHVLFVVLEGVTAADFERGFVPRPGGFFDQHRNHARYYSRYYATNLDSYTSLIAMTTSIQVPFRAYAAPKQYESVNDVPNVIRALRNEGRRTLFISTYEYQPFVPNPQDWDEVLDRRNLGDLTAWVSLGSSRMESATEDPAALPTILEFVKSTPCSLVMAELIFGHSPEWQVKMGMTPVEYYDTYLVDLWDRLTQAELATSTLLIVVSDHGDRSRAAVPDNYRVPLMVVGEGVPAGEDNRFRSHLDLQPIVAHYLLGTTMPTPRREVVVVGSTERWIYGVIRDNGEHLFVDDNTGRVLSGSLDPAVLHATFQDDVSSFSATFGPLGVPHL